MPDDPEQPVDSRAALRIEAVQPVERRRGRLGRRVGAEFYIVRAADEVAEHGGRVPTVEARERIGVRARGEQQRLVRDSLVDHP